MKILERSLPLVLAAGLYGCPSGEVINPADSCNGGSGGYAGRGGSDVIDSCVENNPGSGINGSEVEYYFIEGDSIDEVIANLANPSDGKISASSNDCYFFISLVEAKSETYLEIDDHPVYCTDVWISNADVSPKSTTYMPKWSGCDTCWDSYLEKLAVHEQGHADICAGSAEELSNKLLKLTVHECWDWNPDMSKYSAFQQLEYDIERQHLQAVSSHMDKTLEYETKTHNETQESVLECEK